MKKNLLLIVSLLISIVSFAQSDYSRGFQNGYKKGYCYNDFGCIAPIPPLTPIPRIGESSDNYQDGYNRGFKRGIEDKQAANTKSSGYSRERTYAPKPQYHSTYSSNYNLLLKALKIKQEQYNRAIERARKQRIATKELERKKAINRMNQVIGYYNAANSYPDKIPNGWHTVFSMNKYDFCALRKVYVSNNRITKYVVDNWSYRTVSYSLPINKAIGKIKLETSEDLLSIFFLKSIANPNSIASPPIESGSVSFWTNAKRGNTDIYVEGNYIGTLTSYFKKGEPNCGQSGTVVFKNKPGTYNFVAKSSRTTWRGTITIRGNSCSKMKLNK